MNGFFRSCLHSSSDTPTRIDSVIGRNNFNEAFSHVGELATDITLSVEGQASHLAEIEDHLRRAVMEHPEEVTREKLAQVEDRWVEYMEYARPYRETNALVGVPMHSEIEDDREKIARLMEEVRSMKTPRLSWDQTLEIAAKMTDAARTARQLDDKLLQCIGATRELREDAAQSATENLRAEAAEARATRAERRARRTLGVSFAAVLVAIVFGVLDLTHSNANPAHPRSAQHAKHASR